MIQTGDPTGTGAGGPGYSFKIERSGKQYPPGTLAMANTGQPDSNGSQFFICQGPQCAGLGSFPGPGYTIFGHVTSGMNVVNAIAGVPVKPSPNAGPGEPPSAPRSPVLMKSVTVRVLR